jgi:hypothetical protein
MVSLMLTVMCLLISVGYAQVHNGDSQIISSAGNLSLDCQKILTPLLSWTIFIYGPNTADPMKAKDRDYRIHLKPFTTQKDTMEILQMLSLKGLAPTTIFDQEKNRGFRANLTLQQVCDVYQLPSVRLTSYFVRWLLNARS